MNVDGVGDFATYRSIHAATPRARRLAVHVPEAVKFATKPKLAVSMIERAMTAGVPFAWVTADSVYGVGEIERVRLVN